MYLVRQVVAVMMTSHGVRAALEAGGGKGKLAVALEAGEEIGK